MQETAVYEVTQQQLDEWYENALNQARQEIAEVASYEDYQDTRIGFGVTLRQS